MISIFKKIQGISSSEAEQLLGELGAGSGPASTVSSIQDSPDGGDSHSHELALPDDITHRDVKTLAELVQDISVPGMAFSWVKVSSGMMLPIPSPSTFAVAITAFFGATGNMYHPYTPEETQELLQELSENGSKTSEASLCEICAITCAGSRYSQIAALSDLGGLFYHAALNLVHSVINKHSEVGIKACSLLAVHTVLDNHIIAAGLLGVLNLLV